MRHRIKTAANILFASVFLGIILMFAVQNAGSLKKLLASADKSPDKWQKSAASVEASFKNKIKGRNRLIDLYGVSLMALNCDIVGNLEFVKDNAGIVIRFERPLNEERAISNIKQLREKTKEKNIPLVYVALPNKAARLPDFTGEFEMNGSQSYRIGQLLKAEQIDCLDLNERIGGENASPTFEKFYFKTDVHLTTYAEFWTARELVCHLSENYHINFSNANLVFDLNKYTVTSYDFVGNTARSSGKYFAGVDQFELYKPVFDTKLTLNIPFSGKHRAGSFEDVMLNGYEKKSNITEYTYWIINYGQYPSPYYQYENLNIKENAPKVLVICDSVFMRGFSYLALACRRTTILDPRAFFKGMEYVASELDFEDYDAVVVVGTSYEFFNKKFVSKVELPNLPKADMITAKEYGQRIGNRGIFLDTCNGKRLEGKTTIPIDKNALSVKLYGWAADFRSDAPFSDLYVKIGDLLMKCDYTIKRTSVVNHFHKDSLLKTGFQITFPASYLKNGEVKEISFIGVSADGRYIYAPVTYQLSYL